MNKARKYVFKSKDDYFYYNRRIIEEERTKHESEKDIISYKVNVQYYRPYRMHYITIPKSYLRDIDYLRENKLDIFAKGKILTFASNRKYKRRFYFDAVIDSSEEDENGIAYAYLVPIQERYRYKLRKNILGYYTVKERNGDVTYQRMEQALNDFDNGDCCSRNLERYILGHNIYYYNMDDIFNYNRYYPYFIPGYFRLNPFQRNKIDKILNNEMTTLLVNSRIGHKIICLIIYAIYQMRLFPEDKILVCSSSNTSADNIALELLDLKKYVRKLDILRIYAKNQEIIKRHVLLDDISYHKLIKKEENRDHDFGGRNKLIEENDIIISTCVNSFCDEIINYDFPFVIIVDADNSNENENLIPITLNAKHVLLIAYEDSGTDNMNLYKRMKYVYPENYIYL